MIDSSHKKYLLYILGESKDSIQNKTIMDFLDQEKLEKYKEYTIDVVRCYDMYRVSIPNLMTYEQFSRDFKIDNILL